MALYDIQVALQMDTGLPEDRAMNTWHFAFDGVDTPTTTDEIASRLILFYEALQGRMSSLLATDGHTITFFDHFAPSPRQPLRSNTFGLVPGGDAGPSEVALCLSYHGALVSGQPAGRRRNRIYWGPLSSATLSGGVQGRPNDAVCIDLRDAAVDLLALNDTITWVGYSRMDDLDFEITGGWVDNAFDIQRRRGVRATNRQTF